MGKTSNAVKDRWKAANYDRATLYLPKGTRDELHAWCQEHGETINTLAKKLMEEKTGIRLT